jgi:hypothetical protein
MNIQWIPFVQNVLTENRLMTRLRKFTKIIYTPQRKLNKRLSLFSMEKSYTRKA